MNRNKGFAHLLILFASAIALAILFIPIPYYVSGQPTCLLVEDCPKQGLNWGPSYFERIKNKLTKKAVNSAKTTPTPIQTPDNNNNEVDTYDWNVYRNEKYGFVFKYPNTMINRKCKYMQKGIVTLGNISNYCINIDISSPGPDISRSFTKNQLPELKLFDLSKLTRTLYDETIEPIARYKKSSFDENMGFLNIYIYGFSTDNNTTGTLIITFKLNTSDKDQVQTTNQILSTFEFLNNNDTSEIPGDATGQFCGGIAANLPQFQCPEGYTCKLDGNHPDAGGVCVKI